MLKQFLRSLACGLLGLAVGAGIVQFAVWKWDSLSSHWIDSGGILPMLGLLAGLGWAAADEFDRLRALRRLLILVAIPLGALGGLLAFVITSRTWFADKIPPEQSSFLFQLMNPSVLPTFGERSGSGSGMTSEVTYGRSLFVGAFAAPLVMWLFTRKMNLDPKPPAPNPPPAPQP